MQLILQLSPVGGGRGCKGWGLQTQTKTETENFNSGKSNSGVHEVLMIIVSFIARLIPMLHAENWEWAFYNSEVYNN